MSRLVLSRLYRTGQGLGQDFLFNFLWLLSFILFLFNQASNNLLRCMLFVFYPLSFFVPCAVWETAFLRLLLRHCMPVPSVHYVRILFGHPSGSIASIVPDTIRLFLRPMALLQIRRKITTFCTNSCCRMQHYDFSIIFSCSTAI